jgi:hypothetical protein
MRGSEGKVPHLLIDGEDYAVNLAQPMLARTEYLLGSRIAVLSIDGLAAFQARISHDITRIIPLVAQVKSREQLYCREFELWEMWAAAENTEDRFQDWLDGPSPTREVQAGRDSFQDSYKEIKAELEAELADG